MTPGLGGICYLIAATNAVKAIIRVVIEATLTERSDSKKNIPRFIIPNIHNGRKIVKIDSNGNLKMGMLKFPYWKYSTLEPLLGFLVRDSLS